MTTDSDGPIACNRYRLNERAVVADIIDGEAVIMNLERGNYYSLDRNGAAFWRLIVDGQALSEIASAAAAWYQLPSAAIALDVDRLVAKLVEEQLIVPAIGPEVDRPLGSETFAAGDYSAPTLAIYSDMKDLLALDPPLPSFTSG